MGDRLHEIPVTSLKGVGAALADKLVRIGIQSLQDLLFHLPLRYQDRTHITPIDAIRFGMEVVIQGTISSTEIANGRRRSLLCRVRDSTGIISLRFYRFSSEQRNTMTVGIQIRCFGEPRQGASGLEMYHPEWCTISDENASFDEKTLTPIYPSTEGLTQQRLRTLCSQALSFMNHPDALQEWLPASLLSADHHWSLTEAIRYLHNPPSDANVRVMLEGRHPAQQRLAFEELLAHHLSLQKIRLRIRRQHGHPMSARQKLTTQFLERLPFTLTSAQQRVAREISDDLLQSVPMLRLVQGDVGSGKTVVAALAVLQAVENDFQATLMAPTEILAEQHYNNFTQWLKPLGITVAWLTGKTKGKRREQQLELISSGEAAVIIGTHALFQNDVMFNRLGLAIIDEQHRFGVHQRLALKEKGQGATPHQLIMTATPIPRTLAMSVYADLDCSVIDELPPGRTPVNTIVINDDRRDQVIERARHACLEGRQIYWVCTLIEKSEVLQCQAAEVTAEQLREWLPEISIGLIHGRMKSVDKIAVMQAFKEGHLHLLVATTVIEVGVDVPNASLMIIENSERLGLAQLHQLRGRVGRGKVASHCVLMYHGPLSRQGRERIQVMRDSTDGFVIAEKDLELRGPGEVLGTRQTGMIDFRIADLKRDEALLSTVKHAASQLMSEQPDSIEPLIRRWLPRGDHYAEA